MGFFRSRSAYWTTSFRFAEHQTDAGFVALACTVLEVRVDVRDERVHANAEEGVAFALMTNTADADALYRNVIDRLVDDCHNGQGQIGPRRARDGVWNRNATAKQLPDQHAINDLLARLNGPDREVLAKLLEQAFVGGVHTALAALHEIEVPPFDKAYEGTPYHDFVGRLDDWEWPRPRERS